MGARRRKRACCAHDESRARKFSCKVRFAKYACQHQRAYSLLNGTSRRPPTPPQSTTVTPPPITKVAQLEVFFTIQSYHFYLRDEVARKYYPFNLTQLGARKNQMRGYGNTIDARIHANCTWRFAPLSTPLRKIIYPQARFRQYDGGHLRRRSTSSGKRCNRRTCPQPHNVASTCCGVASVVGGHLKDVATLFIEWCK